MIRIGHCHLRPMDWPSYASIASRTPQSPDQQRAVLARNVLDALENNPSVFFICERMLLKRLHNEGYRVGYVEEGCVEHQIVHVRTDDGWLEIDPQTGKVIQC